MVVSLLLVHFRRTKLPFHQKFFLEMYEVKLIFCMLHSQQSSF